MHDLIPLTALGQTRAQIDSHGTVMLEERPDVALASVTARAGHADATRAALAKLIGAPAPDVGQSAGSSGGFTALWVGPDQWLIEARYSAHPDLAAHVKQALGTLASVTEQTDALTRFDLTGADIHAVLERLTPLDTRAMPNATTARTAIHHITCTLLQTSPTQTKIYTPRASAKSTHNAITNTMNAIK